MLNDAEFISKLMESTISGKVNWQPTGLQAQFAASFGGKWTILIDQAHDGRDATYYLILNNSEGDTVLRITEEDESRLAELFEMARRFALKVDSAIADIMKELDE
jgi:hypothetical protein